MCGKRIFQHKIIVRGETKQALFTATHNSLIKNQARTQLYAKQSRIKQFICMLHAMTFQVERIYALLFKQPVVTLFELMPSCGLFTIGLNLQVCLVFNDNQNFPNLPTFSPEIKQNRGELLLTRTAHWLRCGRHRSYQYSCGISSDHAMRYFASGYDKQKWICCSF